MPKGATKAAKTKRTPAAPAGVSRADAQELLQWLARAQPQIVGTIKHLVEIESPSSSKAAVDELSRHLAQEFRRIGGKVTMHPQKKFGDHLQVDFAAARGGNAALRPVLLLGHLDTVWDAGTLRAMPFLVQRGRLLGPGVYDMKTGIAQMMFAVRALQQTAGGLPRPVTILLVSDEEIGSESSRKITEALAKKSAAVLVCEPSQGQQGALKTWRKGVGDYTLRVKGRASHAGVDFTAGDSAVLELAQQLLDIAQFTDLERGITVNPGVVRGGTRTNVVPGEAVAEIDVRIRRLEDAAYVEQKFRSLRPKNKRCRLEISGGMNRPPMERSAGVERLYRIARQVGEALRIDIQESGTGGGSDGNFTAALGIPTLDGLGAVGEGAHATTESVFLDEIPRRTALLALLIAGISW
ncbi:MAG TPA: M20 family metallopeptidase [Terriglobales bacterium]|nr:M20 family metallopeptidase [Terriglobales bacterium]